MDEQQARPPSGGRACSGLAAGAPEVTSAGGCARSRGRRPSWPPPRRAQPRAHGRPGAGARYQVAQAIPPASRDVAMIAATNSEYQHEKSPRIEVSDVLKTDQVITPAPGRRACATTATNSYRRPPVVSSGPGKGSSLAPGPGRRSSRPMYFTNGLDFSTILRYIFIARYHIVLNGRTGYVNRRQGPKDPRLQAGTRHRMRGDGRAAGVTGHHHEHGDQGHHHHGRRGGRARRGELKFLVLDALRDSPKHGYEIIKSLEERVRRPVRPQPRRRLPHPPVPGRGRPGPGGAGRRPPRVPPDRARDRRSLRRTRTR